MQRRQEEIAPLAHGVAASREPVIGGRALMGPFPSALGWSEDLVDRGALVPRRDGGRQMEIHRALPGRSSALGVTRRPRR